MVDVLKVADFGFAKKLVSGTKATTYCGTEDFMAPEIHNFTPYDYKVLFNTLFNIFNIIIFFRLLKNHINHFYI